MTVQQVQEKLGQSYLLAVASKARTIIASFNQDLGFDGSLKSTKYIKERKRHLLGGLTVDYQLKSTVTAEFEDEYLIYDLEVKNYNDLIEKGFTPRILILYVMPRDEAEWVCVSKENTMLRKCAWWVSLEGMEKSDNDSTQRIRIPLNQMLTPDTAPDIFEWAQDRTVGRYEIY